VEATVQAVVRADENALVQQAQAGNRQAFAQLVGHYWERLYRWLCHLSHDQHTAEDLAQETFMKAFAGLAGFQSGTNFQAWLFRIGHNLFVNHARSNRRGRQPFPEDMTSVAEGPVEQAVTRETLQLLARSVGRLPSEYRVAFLLRVEENMSFQAIAEVLDVTEETARWRVFKARQKLMDVLAPQLEQEKS
jgi:RNA polymerase sigma-70 factor (ECF subfamily)